MYEDIKTAALYVRYSSSNQTEQSIEGQVRVCTEFAQRHGIQIVETYADRATSASKDIEKRIEFLRMIKDSEKNTFQAVIVYKLDRFARSRYDMATYKFRLKKNGVQLISATENISQDPEGIILESVLEGMAEFYSAELSQKINRGLRESALKHNSVGGRLPLGYKTVNKKMTPDEKTAPIVKEAFSRFADGQTIASICRDFNAKGYRTTTNSKFGRSSFTKMFRNEVYLGTYRFHDIVAENAFPAIIDKELWERVQNRLKEYKAPGSNKAKRNYLLSGKVVCGHCGSNITGNCNSGPQRAYYSCSGRSTLSEPCRKRSIRKEYLEKIIVQDALELLTDENIEKIAETAVRANNKELENTTEIPAIKVRMREIDTSLINLMKAIESGNAPEILVKRISELERDKRILAEQLKEEEKSIIYLDKDRILYWLEQFRDGDIEDEDFQKKVIDLFVNTVTIWDEPENQMKLTIAYNLTGENKTYHLSKSDTSKLVVFEPQTWRLECKSNNRDLLFHTIQIVVPIRLNLRSKGSQPVCN